MHHAACALQSRNDHLPLNVLNTDQTMNKSLPFPYESVGSKEYRHTGLHSHLTDIISLPYDDIFSCLHLRADKLFDLHQSLSLRYASNTPLKSRQSDQFHNLDPMCFLVQIHCRVPFLKEYAYLHPIYLY